MGRSKFIEHSDFNERVLDLDRRVYDEAATGSSWFEAGVLVGLEGHHHQVVARAQRLARSYARLCSQEWPLPDADVQDGRGALQLAMQGLSWGDIAQTLRYLSAEEAEQHASVAARRDGVDLSQLSKIRLGRAAYVLRQTHSNWKIIAAELGSMENTVKVAAGIYAQATKSPWPLRHKPPPWGEMAYKRRAETLETWRAIAAEYGIEWDYLQKEAKEYAIGAGLRWPLPPPPRLFRDTGAESYNLRAKERLSWEEIGQRLGVSAAWALKTAQRYVNESGAPWPIRLVQAETIEETAYVLREQGHGWEDIAQTMSCSYGVAVDRAKRFAARTGKPWPIPTPPVRTTFSARAKEAYERGYVGKESWNALAQELGYTGGQSCQNSARVYAERFGLPLLIRRRGKLTRSRERQRQAYEMRAAQPQASWPDIGKLLGYAAWRSAHTAAHNWAVSQGLPWPPEVLGEKPSSA